MRRIIALSGGIGGAKLALGLYRTLARDTLAIIVNTGDDFDHLGLRICPDVDTVLYTLAGLANPRAGWGRRDETWTFMRALEVLGGETWFRLGDADLALHLERTRRLTAGESLSGIIADISLRLAVAADVVPMTDDPVRTRVLTVEGELAFQDYFVRRRCRPAVHSVRFEGAAGAHPAPGLSQLLATGSVGALLICPSNPYLSIDPLLAVPGMRRMLRAAGAPIVAVTPLIGDSAVKGPTAKMMREMGLVPTAVSIARHYAGLIDGFVLDARDRHLQREIDVPVLIADTMMSTLADRERLACETLAFAAALPRLAQASA